MKKYISIIAAFFLLTSLSTGNVFAAVVDPPAGYAGPYAEVCADNPSATVCQDQEKLSTDTNTSPIYGPDGVLPKVANILAIAAGIIAVVMIMVSGLKMITSTGDSKKFGDARNGIIYASVGLVIVLMARVIIEFILRTIA